MINNNPKARIILILAIVILFASCGTNFRDNNTGQPAIKGNEEAILATLFNHYSTEYKTLAWQAFNLASERITHIAHNSESTKNLAVVVDIDETILDNSPHQALTILTGNPYPSGWNEWCSMAVAEAIPGSLDFLNLADSLGFSIFYVSNRDEHPLYEPTFRNLSDKGFPQVSSKSLMLRTALSKSNMTPSDKQSRRDQIKSAGYEVVLYAGDNLGDFYSDNETGNNRLAKASKECNNFGTLYIVLPNPMYGNWPSAAGADGTQEAYLTLLHKMTEPFRKK